MEKSPKLQGLGELLLLLTFWDTYKTCLGPGGWKEKSKLEYPRLKVDVVLEFEI